MHRKLMQEIADQRVSLLDSNADELLRRAHQMVEMLYLPQHCLYTKQHMWVHRQDARRFSMVGATEVMTWRLRAVTDVHIGENIIKAHQGEIVGQLVGLSALDAKRSTIPIVSPLSGVINPVNEKLQKRFLRRARPELVRTDPYDEGWIMAILGESEDEFRDLLDARAYRDLLRRSVKAHPAALFSFGDSEVSAANPSRARGIFISYRRADSGEWAKKLAKRIERYYGSFGVYLDVARDTPGRDYRLVIQEYLENADVVVVLVGRRYFSLENQSGTPRIRTPNDPVGTEIRVALEQNKIVCPLLVDGAAHPEPEDWPDDLRELAFRESFRVNSEKDLDDFVAMLRPDILAAGGGRIQKPGAHAIPGLSASFRDSRNDLLRARTALTYQLIEMGWLLDPAADGGLRHPDFPQYRFRFGAGNFLWLEEQKRGLLGGEHWEPVRPFPSAAGMTPEAPVLSLPKDLRRAAANPDAFLEEFSQAS